ncbi:uncharacterized protein LOC120445936 [Drosophila santomea]|uniref:uncharacterized protein LOC120445936 n=1 Tax=Drosophila santomea TaxID=129105 RepID=UPI001952B256|nr:uncharacterized protein LOC120445936 [Drosophila santomea]
MSCVTKESPPTSNSKSNSNSNYSNSNSKSGSCHTQATATTTITTVRDRNGGEITWRATSGNCGLMNIPQ